MALPGPRAPSSLPGCGARRRGKAVGRGAFGLLAAETSSPGCEHCRGLVIIIIIVVIITVLAAVIITVLGADA